MQVSAVAKFNKCLNDSVFSTAPSAKIGGRKREIFEGNNQNPTNGGFKQNQSLLKGIVAFQNFCQDKMMQNSNSLDKLA